MRTGELRIWVLDRRCGVVRYIHPELRWAVLALSLVMLAGCGSLSTSPTATVCNGIAAEMGGCAEDLPTFEGRDCDAVARQWGQMVNRSVLRIISGPDAVDGEARSVRLRQSVVLLSSLAGRHLDNVGVRSQCESARFLELGEEEFSDQLRDQVGRVMFDGDPVVPYDEWRADLARTVTSIEEG